MNFFKSTEAEYEIITGIHNLSMLTLKVYNIFYHVLPQSHFRNLSNNNYVFFCLFCDNIEK